MTSWLIAYIGKVLWGWQSAALGLLGLNELSEWVTGRSLKWVHSHRIPIAVFLLLVAQAVVHYQQASQGATVEATPIAPVVAENPDHTRLAERLEAAEGNLRLVQDARDRERDARIREHNGREAAEKRVGELARELASARGRSADCDRLAKLSSQGLTLIANLRAQRADQESRGALDRWYSDVCSTMSPAQCAAFKAAPPAAGGWVGYPVEDGGYSQTSRGRSAYLSSQLAALCR